MEAEPTLESCSMPSEILRYLIKIGEETEQCLSFGTFSTALYDTAWLSMVHKEELDQVSWLFPESFNYILETQLQDGTWSLSTSDADRILNTLVALLSLLTRRMKGPHESNNDIALSWRIDKAQTGLESLLQTWDISETLQVGFEIIVPSLLRQLQSFGIHFNFPASSQLMEIHSRKMTKFTPAILYEKQQVTFLHSLEAFVGLIEFDKVRHHCTDDTGIFGSPAATAAYLIHSTAWDLHAETYLRKAVDACRDNGGVPNAFPTCVFELSWAISTLLTHGVQLKELGRQPAANISLFLMQTLRHQNGLIGFAPGVLEDVDDTARTLIALRSLGHSVDPKPMIDRFEAEDHFKTYESERHSSFSANCNVLLALLDPSSAEQYASQIGKIQLFLLQRWDDGRTIDKWNTAPQYSLMLFCEALVRLLKMLDAGDIGSLPNAITQDRLICILAHLLSQTLSDQQSDGSWQASAEVTSYGVLTVARGLSLPWAPQLRATLAKSLCRGRSFLALEQADALKQEYLWIEKTTYGSQLLRKVYCISALHAPYSQCSWNSRLVKLCQIEDEHARGVQRVFSALPFFQQPRLLSFDLVLIEAAQYVDRLGLAESTIFAPHIMQIKKGKYQKIIPVIWVACNHLAGHALTSKQLWTMIELSLFIYQTDEYMESVIVHTGEPELSRLITQIIFHCGLPDLDATEERARNDFLATEHEKTSLDGPQVSYNHEIQEYSTGHVSMQDSASILSKFIKHVLHHPAVLRAPKWSQKELAAEVHNFLLAHIQHSHDSRILLGAAPHEASKSRFLQEPQRNYFKWVQSVASDDTSCPMAFRFFTCLIEQPGQPVFDGPQAQYISQSLTRHLSAMCRQYNDCGSAMRDAEEGNLNSLHFPEFNRHNRHRSASMQTNGTLSSQKVHTMNGVADLGHFSCQVPAAAKKELMEIAEYERACMQMALQNMRKVVKAPAALKALEVYIDVTDLFGQIYVAQDLSSRRK